MPTQQTLYLDFDPKALNANNLIALEPHTTAATTNRLILPKYGAFFSKDLVLYKVENGTNIELVRNVDYILTELLDKVTAKIGLDVYSVILVTESTIATNFKLTYRALGGADQLNRDNLFAMLDLIQNPVEQIQYKDILHKPKGFTPAPHLQDALDMYGLEYIKAAVDKLQAAILVSDATTHQELINQIYKKTQSNLNIADNIHPKINTAVALTRSAEDTLLLVKEALRNVDSALTSTKEKLQTLKIKSMDYAAANYNDRFADVSNLLCYRNYVSGGTIMDVPALIAPEHRLLYLKAEEYDAALGVWSDTTDVTTNYVAPTGSKPTKVISAFPLNSTIQAVRFSNGQYLEKVTGRNIVISENSTMFIVSSIGASNHIKINLFNSPSQKLQLDTSVNASVTITKTAPLIQQCYKSLISEIKDNRPVVSVNRIATRTADNLGLSSDPYQIFDYPTGIVTATLKTDLIDLHCDTIGSDSADQSADIHMILVYDRLLSTSEIHAILTYIRLKYDYNDPDRDANVTAIENGTFVHWDRGFGTDLQNGIDTVTRGEYGTVGVTTRPISRWLPAETWTHPVLAPEFIKVDNNPYLLVLSKDASRAFWRQILNLDANCRYELKFSIVACMNNRPQIQIKLNGAVLHASVTLHPTQSLLKGYTVAFTPTQKSNKIEFFNLNDSVSGNAFGIANISLVRKIYTD